MVFWAQKFLEIVRRHFLNHEKRGKKRVGGTTGTVGTGSGLLVGPNPTAAALNTAGATTVMLGPLLHWFLQSQGSFSFLFLFFNDE